MDQQSAVIKAEAEINVRTITATSEANYTLNIKDTSISGRPVNHQAVADTQTHATPPTGLRRNIRSCLSPPRPVYPRRRPLRLCPRSVVAAESSAALCPEACDGCGLYRERHARYGGLPQDHRRGHDQQGQREYLWSGMCGASFLIIFYCYMNAICSAPLALLTACLHQDLLIYL